MTGKLTHLNEKGEAAMVDVGAKAETERTATARGEIRMSAGALALLSAGKAPKGDVLAAARIAGIMAAKKTSDLIPLCHPLQLTKVSLDLAPDQSLLGVVIEATVKTAGRTGVEMEALTAVTVAALTVYDMLKAVDKAMRIENVRLVFKEGGRSGRFEAD